MSELSDNNLEEDKIVRDPVCGMKKPISQMKAKAIYKGKTYYFCWDRDKQMFLANPDHWIPREPEKRKKEVI